jgi:hypothetical protein
VDQKWAKEEMACATCVGEACGKHTLEKQSVVDLTSKLQTKRKKKKEGKGGGEDLTNRWGAWEDKEKGKTLTRNNCSWISIIRLASNPISCGLKIAM